MEYQRFEGHEQSGEMQKLFKDENKESYKQILDYDVGSLRLKNESNE